MSDRQTDEIPDSTDFHFLREMNAYSALNLCLTVSIDSIREICEGKQSEIFQRYSEGCFDPNCCFSLYYGEHMESLDLVSGTGDKARTWITGLRYLMAGISDEDSLAKRQRTRDQYPPSTCSLPGVSWIQSHLCSSVSGVISAVHPPPPLLNL